MKNTIFLSMGTLLTKGMNFIMVPFFSAWLSKSDYGTFDLYSTYIALLIPVITISSSDAIFRLSVNHEDLNKKKIYITNGLVLDFVNLLLISIGLLIYCLFSAWRYGIPFFLLLVGTIAFKYLEGFLRALKRLDIYSICSAIVTVIIAIFSTTTVRILNMGLSGLLFGYAAGYIVGAILIAAIGKLHRYINFSFISKKFIKEIISYSSPLIPNNIAWWVIGVADRILIVGFLGADANGIYAVANKITNMSASVFSMFNVSWQQKASEITNEKERASYFNRIYNSVTSIIISLCAGMLSINFILYDYIFDPKYNEGRMYTPILISAVIFLVLSQFFGGIQISLMRPKENAITTVFGAIANIIVNLMLIKFIGLYAASMSTLVANMLVAMLRRNKIKDVYCFDLVKENYLLSVFYFYFFCISYIVIPTWFSFINVALAILLFFSVNKLIIYKIFGSINGLLMKLAHYMVWFKENGHRVK